MENSLLSVILLTYNNQTHIFETIQSILDQDHPCLELIVSDDASDSFDSDRIKQYINDNKRDNIKSMLVRQNTENLGTTAHMNRTAEISGGKYIKFISAGDKLYYSSALKELCIFMDQQRCPVVTSMSAVCSEDFNQIFYYFPGQRRATLLNTLSGIKLFSALSFSNIVSALGCLFDESFFSLDGGFNESYRLLEDCPTWLRIARAGGRIPCFEKVTVYYAVGGVSSKDGTAFESENLRDDMLLCFEEEILPYLNEIGTLKKSFIKYQYLKLKRYGEYTSAQKAAFQLRYLPFASYNKAKAVSKLILKRIRMG